MKNSIFDKKAMFVRVEKHLMALLFKICASVFLYKMVKLNEVRYYGKDGKFKIIEHYDSNGKIYKNSTKKY